MFGRRKQHSAEIRTDREIHRPGDVLRATVRITPGTDIVEPEFAVALLHTDSLRDGGSSWSDSWAVDGRYVFVGRRLRAGEAVDVVVELLVPEHTTPLGEYRDEPLSDDPDDFRSDIDRSEVWGAPTSAGRKVRSEWAVQVTGHGLDERHPVVVLAPAGPVTTRTEPRGESDLLAAITVDVPERSVAAGGTVSGRLRVEPRRELDVRGLRVDLLLVETAGDRLLTAEHRGGVEVSGPTRLSARLPHEVPFTLQIPADATPSVTSGSTAIRWVLHGVVDLPRREDAVGRRELVVHDPRA